MADQNKTAAITKKKITNECTNVTFPQVEGLKNREIEDKINAQIENQMTGMLPTEGCDVYQNITGVYQVTLNQKGLLSIYFEVYSIRNQAANGSTTAKSLTANLETGETYQLHDLFKRNSDYRVIVSNMIQQQIEQREIPLINEFKGINDYEQFNLTGNSLEIYFQELKYTPHSVGIPQFSIPYAQIRNIINPDSPIARLLEESGSKGD